VAKLARGTGEDQAAAVYMALEEWGIDDRVRAMSFDTTSSNTGRIAGACVLLEQKLGKELLSLACRHYVMELIIGAVFKVCLGSTSSPEVPLFKRFQGHWQFIDQQKYETALTNNTEYQDHCKTSKMVLLSLQTAILKTVSQEMTTEKSLNLLLSLLVPSHREGFDLWHLEPCIMHAGSQR
jgi:hypothetical protein